MKKSKCSKQLILLPSVLTPFSLYCLFLVPMELCVVLVVMLLCVRWGTRFPDVGDIYTAKLRLPTLESLPQVTAGLWVGPTFRSPLDARLARALLCDVIVTDMVPEAIVCKHAGLSVIAVASVTAETGEAHVHRTTCIRLWFFLFADSPMVCHYIVTSPLYVTLPVCLSFVLATLLCPRTQPLGDPSSGIRGGPGGSGPRVQPQGRNPACGTGLQGW